MEVEVRIPRDTLPCGQHKTSFTHAHFSIRARRQWMAYPTYCPTFREPIPVFRSSGRPLCMDAEIPDGAIPSEAVFQAARNLARALSLHARSLAPLVNAGLGMTQQDCWSTVSLLDRLALSAGPSGHPGFRSGAALRAGRFPGRDKAVSAGRLHRMVRSRPWRS